MGIVRMYRCGWLVSRVLSRKKNWGGGKLGLRTVLAALGGGRGRGMYPLPRKARKQSPF